VGEVVLARHGETEWSRAMRHTGRTDIPLTETGRAQAEALAPRLAAREFALVLSSPLSRALDTCRLAGLGERAEIDADLEEWDYGEYDGVTSAEIRDSRPGWSLWADGCPGGESPADVGARAGRVLARLKDLDGDAVLFAHGHVLRVIAARWLGLAPADGSKLALDVGTLSVLGHEHQTSPVIRAWNVP
jgi:probable phosphoglycerate mutase